MRIISLLYGIPYFMTGTIVLVVGLSIASSVVTQVVVGFMGMALIFMGAYEMQTVERILDEAKPLKVGECPICGRRRMIYLYRSREACLSCLMRIERVSKRKPGRGGRR